MWTKNIQHKPDYSTSDYNGIKIYAAPGLHEEMFKLFTSYGLPKNSKILILGAGGGAFDQRLIDNGYYNITATDINTQVYQSDGKIVEFDLNKDFSTLGEYDIVIAMEIIEHVENAFEFLRRIRKILSKEGIFLLSTPNPKSVASRLNFLIKGEMLYFENRDISGVGHINPIFDHILKYYLNCIDLHIDKKRSLNEFSILRYKKRKILRTIPKIILIFLTKIFIFNSDDRIILIYGIKKK